MRLSLRAGERVYVNGAVLRVDRKVSLELLNDATFLLETHVLQAEAATTPLRQLYFAVQALVIDPANADRAMAAGFLQSLWGVLIEDLQSEENGLPPDLRADLVSIGLWSMHEANAVIATPQRDLSALITVNTAIRDGLR